MYRVILKDDYSDQFEKVLHEPLANGNKLLSGKGTLRIVGCSSFTAQIPPTNDYFHAINSMKSIVEIYDVINDRLIFEGRVLDQDFEFKKDGTHYHKIVAEDFKSYFRDTSQRYAKRENKGVRDLLAYVLNVHNEQAETHKQFVLGTVTVDSDTDAPYRWIDYGTTFDILQNMFLRDIGGYFVIRRNEQKQLVLDYLKEVGRDSDMRFEYGQNVVRATKETDNLEVITVIEPLGANVDDNNDDVTKYGTKVTRPRLNISSVNGGSPYIRDEELIQVFGEITRQVNFSDITDPTVLKNRGLQFKEEQMASLNNWDLTLINRGLIDPYFETIEVGNRYVTDLPMLASPERLQLTEVNFDVHSFSEVQVKVGDTNSTLSMYKLMNREARQSMARLNSENYDLRINQTKLNQLILDLDNAITNKASQEIIDELQRQIDELKEQIETGGTN